MTQQLEGAGIGNGAAVHAESSAAAAAAALSSSPGSGFFDLQWWQQKLWGPRQQQQQRRRMEAPQAAAAAAAAEGPDAFSFYDLSDLMLMGQVGRGDCGNALRRVVDRLDLQQHE
jgi:hypothetical protein